MTRRKRYSAEFMREALRRAKKRAVLDGFELECGGDGYYRTQLVSV
jgi:hypothetical protein